ncbi:thiamine pyrophosphate-binding protein [Candidatus Poriferisodalis sp.]|uniref:thiamine pyrophosphate-binding protein n=1 Tax=Candidatus Poriferisodalis sp. TaxID=3101277 RepID=UPI003B59939E
MSEMTGGEAVAATLARLGVRHMFGIVSVHNLPMYEALSVRDDIEVVKVRHEQAAAHAADAYFRATGEMGVLLTSTGPGAANAVAGLYEAGFSSSAVLMVTGQTESRFYGKGKGFLHENEGQLAMLRSVCRSVASVRHPGEISTEIARVADDVRTGRPQPGAVEIPIDFQYARVGNAAEAGSPQVARLAPNGALLDDAAERLATAERPVIWAGGGVNIADASGELAALAQRLGAPVFTTIEGRGSISEEHPLSLGFRSDRPQMADVFAEADLLLAVGTRFQNYATRVWALELPAELIHLDVDPGVIGLNYKPSLAVVGDAKLSLAGLVERLGDGAPTIDDGFVERSRKHRAADMEALRDEIGADHAAICDLMRQLLPHDARIVRDTTVPGYMWGNRLLPIVAPRTSIRAANAAIGPGVPMAVGAALGTGKPTVVIQGDGGLMLSIGEISSLAEHSLPVIVCVFNDGGYGVLRIIQDALWDEHHGTEIGGIDFVGVAQAMGVPAERVTSVAEFEAAFGRAVDRASGASGPVGPTLLDIDLTALIPITFPLPAHQRRRED